MQSYIFFANYVLFLPENVYLRSQMKITKNNFLLGFGIVVLILALIKAIFPEVSTPRNEQALVAESPQPVEDVSQAVVAPSPVVKKPVKKHRIRGVQNYKATFPDSQAVRPVKSREDAEKRKKELVFVGANPYYHVDPLYSSIPYLVPRAAILLEDIGKAFYDSLYVKGVPFNQLIVTSVLRSESDVVKLRRRNGNATERSCHLFGTTFDICYNRYHAVTQPVRDDTLKWVLCEVLRDMREQGRCYIKYEVKQGCFHMTVR